uniref:Moesin/ezrin/radixin homolog 1 n=1 Tax=Strongyloides venezuelensis TaxID=75913 RepID=A0A0K0FC48_STRVS
MFSNVIGQPSAKVTYCKVTSMVADLEKIPMSPDWKGNELFETVCRILGIREYYYFGLQFTNKKGIVCWLQLDQKIVKQNIGKEKDEYHFYFLVKFYPENVEEELIQDVTRHLFYLQIKQSILNMDLYCSPEASVLLASYVCQATYGNFSNDIEIDLYKLLPQSVINQFDMTYEMWEERIQKWWVNNNGMTQEEAEIEYLKIAQELEMFGIQYYPICNQKETDLLLGVSAHGIGIYKHTNRITPRPFFMWSEIKNVSFENKIFTIKVLDKSKIKFKALNSSVNLSILDLCIGTHNLYLRRRQPDLMEVQQMKIQAKEQRQKKLEELQQLSRERQQRKQAEEERDQIRAQYDIISDQLIKLKEYLKQTAPTSDGLMMEQLRENNDTMKCPQQPREVQGLNEIDIMTRRYEQNVKQNKISNQMYRSQIIVSDSAKQNGFYSSYNSPTINNQTPHRHSTFHLSKQLSTNSNSSFSGNGNGNNIKPQHSNSSSSNNENIGKSNITAISSISILNNEIQQLRNEKEKLRNEENKGNKVLKDMLHEFRAEIESLKREEYLSEHDRIHEKNLQTGLDKYSVLRKSGAGSTKSRVQVFDGL